MLPAGLSRMEPVPAFDDDPAAMPRPTRPARFGRRGLPPPRRTNWPLRMAWFASVLFLLAVAGLLYVERETVMEVWPPCIRAYEALGISPA